MIVENDMAGNDGEHVPERYSGDNVRASWPFSLHTIRSNIAHCSPEGKEAMVSAFLWCTDAAHPVTRDDFADRVGYSPNVIYKILSGKYLHPEDKRQLDVPADLVKAIKSFLSLERERMLGGKTEFVITPTAKKIWVHCDLARESQTPVFVIGPSQIGKTWALEHYTRDNNHGRTSYIRMKAASGLGGMVRRIAEKLGISTKSNTANLVDYIKNAVTKDMLLILDEVHLLQYTYRISSFFSCMEVIREIHDETKCGMVLCGTKLLLDRMQEGSHKEMEQTMRRGVHRCILPDQPTKGDIAAICEKAGLEFPARTMDVEVRGIVEKPYEVLRQLSKNQGLKAITERLRYATKLASRRGGKVNWQTFIEAHLTIAAASEQNKGWD